MAKNIHEIRDPIHVFVRLDNRERDVVDSRPFQRLRHIHQLAMTYLVYPGATHRRFEHSLGVMELAGRVFDVITRAENITDKIRELIPEVTRDGDLPYWRRVLRAAALCHDLGHLPFSHAAEKELLPPGWDHERLTQELILSDELKGIWNQRPPLEPLDIVKLAIGPEKARDLKFSAWETILSEIIVGDAFGVDRMDYLLRDSHHVGVVYGTFDHYRLTDTLRILTSPPAGDGDIGNEPALGVEFGGLHTAEALMLARYFMFSQVYFHPVRRIYDIHLKDFLKEWLDNGLFCTKIGCHLTLTDNEVTAAFREAAFDSEKAGHIHAERIICRKHFKQVYERNPTDEAINPDAADAVFNALCTKYGPQQIRRDKHSQKGGAPNFPVLRHDRRIESSLAVSHILNKLPPPAVDHIFCGRDIYLEALIWVESEEMKKIIKDAAVEEEHDNG